MDIKQEFAVVKLGGQTYWLLDYVKGMFTFKVGFETITLSSLDLLRLLHKELMKEQGEKE